MTAVARALRGADAVLHAASVFSFERRQRAAMRRPNLRRTEVVLAAARRTGADRIVQPRLPAHIPAEYGAIYTCACATRVADGAQLPPGLAARPVTDTLADTVRWLHRTGRLTDRQAGAARSAGPEPVGAGGGGAP